MRLVNGTGPNKGRLQVLFNGVWQPMTTYSLSDYLFDANAAAMVCRELGFVGGLASFSFGAPDGVTQCARLTDWYYYRCDIDARSIQECPYFAGNVDCQYPVLVQCSPSRGEAAPWVNFRLRNQLPQPAPAA